MRHIGVLMSLAIDDREGPLRLAAFLEGLQKLGWTVGRNLQIVYRWSGGEAGSLREYAAELVALAPDLILTDDGFGVSVLQQVTGSLPIVVAAVLDPIGAGFVASLARPGGNVTGVAAAGFGLSGKWLDLLKQVVPSAKRAVVLHDPAIPGGAGLLGEIEAVAPAFGIEVSPAGVHDPGELETAISDFAVQPNSALMVTMSPLAVAQRDLIIALAVRLRLPAVYGARCFVADGGLASYGADTIGPYRQTAGYADRILKGEKPGDLPLLAPLKYETAINLKTARTLGIEVSPLVLVQADEVIE
jgi:putative ABC transport system substrate-binding protein